MKRLLVLLALALPLFAGSITNTVTFGPSDLRFAQSDAWDIVNLNGYPALLNPGAPRLPKVVQSVLIPAGAEPVGVELTAEDWITLPGTYRIVPSQPDIPLPAYGKTFPTPELKEDPAVYASSEAYPAAKLELKASGTMSGFRIANVELHPLRYIPATGQLLLATRLSYRLNYTTGDRAVTIPTRAQKETFERAVRRIVVNPRDIARFAPRIGRTSFSAFLPPGDYDYVVITESPMDSVFQRLADWKTSKGVPGTVVLVSWIDANYTGYDLQEKIRNFIKDAYQTWGTTYVLLGGSGDYNSSGQNIIPTRMANYAGDEPCDLYYAGLDGNWDASGDHIYGQVADDADMYSDIYVGRASVYSDSMARVFVSKVLRYEQNPPTDYLKKMMLASAILWSAYEERPVLESLAQMTPDDWFDARLYERAGTLSEQAMIDSMNLGYGMGNWYGHGSPTGIYMGGSPFLSSSDASSLVNGDRVGVVTSIACDVASWDNGGASDCFAEILANNPRGGTLSSIMNTRYGYGALEGGNYVVGPSERLDYTFYTGVFGDLYHTGEALAYSKATWAPYADSSGRYDMQRWCIYDLNLIGDPETPLWTNAPAQADVAHSGVVALGQNVPYTVTVTDNSTPVEGAMVVLNKPGEVNVSGRTDSLGQITLSISALSPGRMSMLVSAHNYFNHQDSVLVASARYLTYLKHQISDPTPGGNGDGILNPGETVNMPVWIKNWGNLTASNVSVTLRSLDPALLVIDSTKAVGDIASGDSACTAGSGFRFRAADTCSNGHEARFRIFCTDNMDSSWTSDFKLKVGNCVLSYAGKRVHDPAPGGNNNGRLDGGDTGELFLTLNNIGLGTGYNIRAVLRSTDPLFQVLDSIGAYDEICSDTCCENAVDSFVVHVDATVAPETEFPCTLVLTGDNFYSDVLPITIMVGELRGVDPIHDNSTPTTYWAIDNADVGYTGRPDYSWIEIRGRGQRLGLSDDQSAPVNLPAAFGPLVFYGQRYTKFSVCSNGWLAPGLVMQAPGGNAALPTAQLPGVICANWDDLNPPAGGDIWVYHDAANHAYIVEWDSVVYKNDSLGADKFQIIIYDTTLAAPDGNNEIVVQYQTANGLSSSTAGIQDPSKSIFINCLFNNTYHRGSAPVLPHSAIKYTTRTPLATDVEEPGIAANPLRLSISAANNPFRGTARVMFSLPRAGPVRLDVYDINGRLVRTLLNRADGLNPGSYTLNWNGRDASERTVSGGVYFYRLESSQGTLACKVIKLD